MVEIIKKLKPIYKLGICSNSPSNFIRTILKKHHLTNLFDKIVISSECGITKPDRKIYELILKNLSAKPEKSIFVNDNPTHIKSAKNIGMKTVLFSSPENLKKALKNFNIEIS